MTGFSSTLARWFAIVLLGTAVLGAPSEARAAESPEALVNALARSPYDPGAGLGDTRAKLVALGTKSVPALIKGLSHYFPQLRYQCFLVLREMGRADDVRKTVLRDPDPDTRWFAGRHYAERKSLEGIDSMVQAVLLTKNASKRGTWVEVLKKFLGRDREFDWKGTTAREGDREAKAWASWWRKRRRTFRFPKRSVLIPVAQLWDDPRYFRDFPFDHTDTIQKLGQLAKDPARRGEVERMLDALLAHKEPLDSDEMLECVEYLQRVGSHRRVIAICSRLTNEENRDLPRQYAIMVANVHEEAAESYKALGQLGKARVSVRRALLLAPADPDLKALSVSLQE